MLTFNSKGLLRPTTNIISTLEEFRNQFVKNKSTRRQELFESYLKYSEALQKVVKMNLLQWINGSYVTELTENPNDIDLVTFIDYSIIDKIEKQLDQFKYPENHPLYPYYYGDRLYWMDRFTKTRRDRNGNKFDKGFIELTY